MDNLPESIPEPGEGQYSSADVSNDFTPASSTVIEGKKPYFMRSIGSLFSSTSSSKILPADKAQKREESTNEIAKIEEDLNSPYDIASQVLFPKGKLPMNGRLK